jgi:hypothetical protein
LRISQPIPPASVNPGDAHRPHVAARGCPPVVVGAGVVLAPGQPRFRHGHSPRRVDVELFHHREVDDEPAVDGAVPGRAVSAPTDGQRHLMGASDVDRLDHVGDLARTHDQRRSPVDGRVPDQARPFVPVAARANDLTA